MDSSFKGSFEFLDIIMMLCLNFWNIPMNYVINYLY